MISIYLCPRTNLNEIAHCQKYGTKETNTKEKREKKTRFRSLTLHIVGLQLTALSLVGGGLDQWTIVCYSGPEATYNGVLKFLRSQLTGTPKNNRDRDG